MSQMDFQVEITCHAPHREREQGKLDLTEISRDLPVHCSDSSCIAASKCALELINCASLKHSPGLRSTSAPCDTRPVHHKRVIAHLAFHRHLELESAPRELLLDFFPPLTLQSPIESGWI